MNRKRLRILQYLLLAAAAFAFYGFSVHDRFVELHRSWERERELETSIQTLRQENGQIEKTIENLEPEGREVERIVREELRWALPDEKVIDLPEKK